MDDDLDRSLCDLRFKVVLGFKEGKDEVQGE